MHATDPSRRTPPPDRNRDRQSHHQLNLIQSLYRNALAENLQLKQRVAQLEKEAAAYKKLLPSLQQEPQPRRTAPAETPATPAKPRINTTPAAPHQAPADPVAKVFTAWCTVEGKRMVSRYTRFSDYLCRQVPDVEVLPVYRDLNAVQLVFGASGEVTNPAEYWMVRTGSRLRLFPQPVNAHQFRDLACFQGSSVSPSSLRHIAPGTLRRQGALLTLAQHGSLA